MAGKIALLFDSLPLRSEAVRYSIELAARMDCDLTLIMIPQPQGGYPEGVAPDRSGELQAEIQDKLEEPIAHARSSGVAVDITVRMGDPSSELMKFLAAARTLKTIVWGGPEEVVGGKKGQRNTHWLVRMKGVLECPVVVPSVKS